MTNVETDQLAWMRQQLDRRKFRDWQLTLELDPYGLALLTIRYQEADSHTGENRWFTVVARIGPYRGLDADRFHADVTTALTEAWMHEFHEANQLDGKPIDDPHADPQRWLCGCGCLGPKRDHHPHWTCTRCGAEHRQP